MTSPGPADPPVADEPIRDTPIAAEPSTVRPVEYKGAPLDSEKGPGLGCFWSQVVVLIVFLILTPASVAWGWPSGVSTGLLIAVLVLLLFTGQTIIFLLRLVAADRRAAGRRRPLGSATPTVGELEDARRATEDTAEPDEAGVSIARDPVAGARAAPSDDVNTGPGESSGGVRE